MRCPTTSTSMYILPENEFLTHQLSITGMSGALPSSGSRGDEVQLPLIPTSILWPFGINYVIHK